MKNFWIVQKKPFQGNVPGNATFGITSPVNHDKVISFIDGELPHMSWYREHGHTKVALAIPGYIVRYLFNYAVPMPVKELFHLYFQLMEPVYFENLGFRYNFAETERFKINKKALKKNLTALKISMSGNLTD
ncbi:MAG: hypothetical protein R2784_16675 [Saprospiraceae bacterium]